MTRPAVSVPTFDVILPSLSIAGERQFATAIARSVAADIGINERILAERLLDAERQTPSPVGCGVAIAHLSLSGLNKPYSILARLRQPLDRRAPDGRLIDLACVLLTPEREGNIYLRSISRLSRFLCQEEMGMNLRVAGGENEMRAALDKSDFGRRAA